MPTSEPKTISVSARIDAATHADLEALADRAHRPTDQLIADAIRGYVHHEKALIEAIEEGIAAADAGRLIDHDDVVAALRLRNRARR